jgi:hypothetical protein
LKIETREVPARTAAVLPPAVAKSTDKPATAAKPVHNMSMEKPNLAAAHIFKKAAKSTAEKPEVAAAHALTKVDKKPALESVSARPSGFPKKSVDKKAVVTAKALTKPVHMAKVDPLAPLPAAHHSGHSKGIAAER